MNHLNVYKLTPEYVLSACECMCAVCVVYEWVDRGIPLVVQYFTVSVLACIHVYTGVVCSRCGLLLCGGLWCTPQVHSMLQGLLLLIVMQRVTLDCVLLPHLQHHQYEGKV